MILKEPIFPGFGLLCQMFGKKDVEVFNLCDHNIERLRAILIWHGNFEGFFLAEELRWRG